MIGLELFHDRLVIVWFVISRDWSWIVLWLARKCFICNFALLAPNISWLENESFCFSLRCVLYAVLWKLNISRLFLKTLPTKTGKTKYWLIQFFFKWNLLLLTVAANWRYSQAFGTVCWHLTIIFVKVICTNTYS